MKAAFMELAHEGMTKVPNGMYNFRWDSLWAENTEKLTASALKKITKNN
jgi:hypothetical protein